mgnify:FL=1
MGTMYDTDRIGIFDDVVLDDVADAFRDGECPTAAGAAAFASIYELRKDRYGGEIAPWRGLVALHELWKSCGTRPDPTVVKRLLKADRAKSTTSWTKPKEARRQINALGNYLLGLGKDR